MTNTMNTTTDTITGILNEGAARLHARATGPEAELGVGFDPTPEEAAARRAAYAEGADALRRVAAFMGAYSAPTPGLVRWAAREAWPFDSMVGTTVLQTLPPEEWYEGEEGEEGEEG